ncbi:uncharacterized protein MYCGRDRAFT_98002 [Zymoseptoria tritici IPO323]|uniref:Uncharacterized protein n=1 Tax=Zymoseptoria tritici (strain CBS 115943 / IPO323) TaxID=336722 RepID=F9XS12_ZYMTI|nr:uncharacterized protein MYCGRDRAFT_98002 [Zymoseptoria tritici IPO323]EGP81889.1 hypothetical protein MYCGRDRAFT_98002 [Zymoseptoria tritici IPO323]
MEKSIGMGGLWRPTWMLHLWYEPSHLCRTNNQPDLESTRTRWKYIFYLCAGNAMHPLASTYTHTQTHTYHIRIYTFDEPSISFSPRLRKDRGEPPPGPTPEISRLPRASLAKFLRESTDEEAGIGGNNHHNKPAHLSTENSPAMDLPKSSRAARATGSDH